MSSSREISDVLDILSAVIRILAFIMIVVQAAAMIKDTKSILAKKD